MIKKILILLFINICLLTLSGCSPLIYSDGLIEYHTLSGEYVLYGLTDEGRKQEYIIVPSIVNGHQVYISSNTSGFYDYGNVKKVYIPFEIINWKLSALNPQEAKVFIFSNSIHNNMSRYERLYVSSWLYNNVEKLSEFNGTVEFSSIINGALIANVSFHFNYNNSPNEGYYWIDDYDYGELITFVPPNPEREGYTFAGWYKEPECINEWLFEKDRLPEVQYDEKGDILFNETELYAKWLNY